MSHAIARWILNHWTSRGVPQLEFIEFSEKDIGKRLIIRLLTKNFEVAKSAFDKRENDTQCWLIRHQTALCMSHYHI